MSVAEERFAAGGQAEQRAAAVAMSPPCPELYAEPTSCSGGAAAQQAGAAFRIDQQEVRTAIVVPVARREAPSDDRTNGLAALDQLRRLELTAIVEEQQRRLRVGGGGVDPGRLVLNVAIGGHHVEIAV